MRVDALSFYLAKLLGVVLVIIGIALFSKTKHFQDTVKEVSKSDAFMTLISFLPLVAGTAIIISHNIWVKHWIVLITIIGWFIFLTGVIRLFFYKECMTYMAKMANQKNPFVYSGIFLFLVGAYLCGKSFFMHKFFF